jgi:hypothetical protein
MHLRKFENSQLPYAFLRTLYIKGQLTRYVRELEPQTNRIHMIKLINTKWFQIFLWLSSNRIIFLKFLNKAVKIERKLNFSRPYQRFTEVPTHSVSCTYYIHIIYSVPAEHDMPPGCPANVLA